MVTKAPDMKNSLPGLESPAMEYGPITPDVDEATPFRALYVGTAGDVVVRQVTGGANTVTFVGVPAGSILPVIGIGVEATGTTADDIVWLR